jgi:hypothetical protein
MIGTLLETARPTYVGLDQDQRSALRAASHAHLIAEQQACEAVLAGPRVGESETQWRTRSRLLLDDATTARTASRSVLVGIGFPLA